MMKTRKTILRSVSLLLALCFTLWLAPGLGTALATSTGERVFDKANLFTASEEQEIRKAITDFQQATGMDFVVLTSDTETGETSQQQVADDFYDQGGYGLGDEHSGALYYIDMYNRQEYLSTAGAMIDYMTDARIQGALDVSNPNLRAGRYADAALAMIAKVQLYVKAGIPEGQYRYDIVTGQMLTARHKVLTGTEMLVGGALCLFIGLIFVLIVQARYKLKGNTYRYDYATNADVDITDSRDEYLRTTVTRTRKAPPPGSGGGGGGSGVHMSGGGVSHGGGGRGF
ncbi:MAG: TPM domain-containing protein [Eubacteriales bacterium]|nr:TPM domain-containing protein [Eubacteriales bacterium]